MTTDGGPGDNPLVPYGTSKRGARCRMVLDLILSTNFDWFFKPSSKSPARITPLPVALVLLLLFKGGLLLLLLLLMLLQLLLLPQLLLLIFGTFNLAILKSALQGIYSKSGHLEILQS